MARRIKVFFLILCASCFFTFSVNAEFTSSDSTNLSSIRSDVSTIRSYISNLSELDSISSYTQSIYNWMVNSVSGLASYLTDISRNLNPNWDNSFADQLLNAQSSLLAAINNLAGKSSIPLYTEFENSESYMTGWNYGQSVNNGYIVPKMQTDGGWVQPWLNNGYNWCLLSSGSYVVTVDTNVSWRMEETDWYQGGRTSIIYVTNISYIKFQFSADPGWFGLKIRLANEDDLARASSSVVDSNISSHQTDLDDGVNQLEGLEDQVFNSLDTSLGSIDFSGSALGQVVSGFTFIRAVFSAIYSSSPYISVLINLSCMFGVLALFLRVQPRFSRWEREHRDRSD